MTNISRVQVVNLGLLALGKRRITSFDENTYEAALARDFYPLARVLVLAEHDWNFAMRRRKLAKRTEVPVFGWEHSFTLPNDALKISGVFGDEHERWSIPYALEGVQFVDDPQASPLGGKVLLTDADEVFLRYIANIEDETQAHPAFWEAAGLKFAHLTALALTELQSRAEAVEDRYGKALRKAKRLDTIASYPSSRRATSWELSRYA